MTSAHRNDEHDFTLLDEYVARLHDGAPSERARFLAEHPELVPVIECLDALDSLAPLGEVFAERSTEEMLSESDGAASDPRPTGQVGSSAPTIDLAALIPVPAGPGAAASMNGPLSGQGRFGEYELLGELGRGGMGVVYRARQLSLDRIVALKLILASHLASDDQVRRFQSEAKASAGLHHPHIVRVFEVGQVHGQHYFSMEYVEGQSLSAAIAAGALPLEDALRCLIGIARAVDHLHQHGVLHRDLKPANILIDGEGRPYLTDFGLAKLFLSDSRSTATGMIAGTPSYMAPEQAAGRNAEIGPAADVYSLGAILYELLAGRPPFQEANPLDTLLQVLEREPPPPRSIKPAVPRELELICLRCLEKSPDARYPTAAALADELERYQAGEDLLVQPPGVWQRLWRWSQREAALSVRIVAVLLFYLVECVDYFLLGAREARFHAIASVIVPTWIVGSILFHRLLKRPDREQFARYGWAALDVVAFTATLLAAAGARSPSLIVYGLLVVLSALWLQRRLISWTALLSTIGYLTLAIDAHWLRPENYSADPPTWAGDIYFLTALAVLAAVMAQQVTRVRALSRYYERWRMRG